VDCVVDGIVDNLITDLSTHLPGSFIISRSTAFAYKGRSAAIRQVGKELGVRYVLEGAVSAGPSHLRVSVQLINAETDEHLWAERFDKERRDILQLQEEIVGRLSRSVASKWSARKPCAETPLASRMPSIWLCALMRRPTRSSER
jgi:TolB-like protein